MATASTTAWDHRREVFPFLARYILRRNGPARLAVSRFMLGSSPTCRLAKAMGGVRTPDGMMVVQTRMTM